MVIKLNDLPLTKLWFLYTSAESWERMCLWVCLGFYSAVVLWIVLRRIRVLQLAGLLHSVFRNENTNHDLSHTIGSAVDTSVISASADRFNDALVPTIDEVRHIRNSMERQNCFIKSSFCTSEENEDICYHHSSTWVDAIYNYQKE